LYKFAQRRLRFFRIGAQCLDDCRLLLEALVLVWYIESRFVLTQGNGSQMKRKTYTFLLGLLVLLYAFPANAEYWEEPLVDQHWNFSIAPGYAMLYVADESKVRNGFGGRLLGHYSITPNWGVELKLRLGIFDGDGQGQQGIYSQVSTTAAFRYTFDLKEWCKPYVFFGLGWVRTELDRETVTNFVAHSLFIEPGAGVAFRINRRFWLGLETIIAPIVAGGSEINGSFTFQTLISADLRF